MLKVGEMAPDFGISDQNGKLQRLSDYRGKRVVLWFYPKADTPGCTAEGCEYRNYLAEFAKKDAVILGASFDTQAENQAFAQKFGYQFPLLCDTEREIGLAYGACANKTDGYPNRITYVIGADGRIEHAYPKVNPKTNPSEILALL